MEKLIRVFLLSVILSTGSAIAADASKLYVFADKPANRAAISNLAGTPGIEIVGIKVGDTTLINLGGDVSGGLILDGLHASGRTVFEYDGGVLATPGNATGLDSKLGQAGMGPSIVIVPIKDLPPHCIYAKCLPPDWAALEDEGGIVGNGMFAMGPGHSGGFIGPGSGTSVGGGHVGNGTGVGGGRTVFGGGSGVGGGLVLGPGISGGYTINGMGRFGGQDGGG